LDRAPEAAIPVAVGKWLNPNNGGRKKPRRASRPNFSKSNLLNKFSLQDGGGWL
jgi:hypothetical protein